MEPVGQILTDVQMFTKAANTTRQIATYGALTIAGVAVWYIPKVWSETSAAIAGAVNKLNPFSMPERFVDWWEERGVPTGIVGDVIKNRL